MTMKDRIVEQVDETETRVLDGVDNIQHRVLEANEKTAERLHDVRVAMPTFEPMFAPDKVVARYYDFAGKLLASNRKFAEGIVKVWYPAPKKKVTPRKTVAKKAAAK